MRMATTWAALLTAAFAAAAVGAGIAAPAPECLTSGEGAAALPGALGAATGLAPPDNLLLAAAAGFPAPDLLGPGTLGSGPATPFPPPAAAPLPSPAALLGFPPLLAAAALGLPPPAVALDLLPLLPGATDAVEAAGAPGAFLPMAALPPPLALAAGWLCKQRGGSGGAGRQHESSTRHVMYDDVSSLLSIHAESGLSAAGDHSQLSQALIDDGPYDAYCLRIL
jgi:hypothetical protein